MFQDMKSVQSSSILYCCVAKGGRVLYTYNNNNNDGNPEIENLAALCLEMAPPYHRWYFHTMGRKTFGFLMEEGGYVYFAIMMNDNGLGKARLLRFLHKFRIEFRNVGKRGCSTRNLNSQLLPVVRHLVEQISGTSAATEWPAELSPSPGNNNDSGAGAGASTKAPLLGKLSKQEKKKMKDHVIAVEMEEQRRSTIDSGAMDSNLNQGTSTSPLRKDFINSSSSRSKPSSQNLQKKWCRQVRIVLAIDAVICLVLFAIWLIVCHGIDCLR